jgi:hypothetical protein
LFIWLIAAALFAAWLVCTFILGKEGYVHFLLMSAVAVAVTQYLQDRRTAQR